MPAGDDRLSSTAVGEIELDGKVLVIRRIRVVYSLRCAEEHRQTAERVHEMHAQYCPVARTLTGCVEIATELTWAED